MPHDFELLPSRRRAKAEERNGWTTKTLEDLERTQFRVGRWSVRRKGCFKAADAFMAVLIMGGIALVLALPLVGLLTVLSWLF